MQTKKIEFGVAAVPLIAIRDNVLTVRALDALDESPVLDIKPHIPQFDRIDGARVPAWVEKFIVGYF
ncbi:MAG: SAM-dependent methyltransferase [Betaproteobacteria bacterium]|nr:SAM-dependent methyltransferase [Betaproteobacteria bacterium]MBI3938246.1 SAM-dependent methyltransferase [Betaproteobacteria bacterium]